MDGLAVRRRLADGRPLLGSWLTLGSPAGASYLAHQGFDWLGVDLEEYPAASNLPSSLVATVRSIAGMPLVRSRSGGPGALTVARATGAAGVFIPKVGGAAEAAAQLAVLRSDSRTDDVLGIITLETTRGLDHAAEILAVPGVDACFLMPGMDADHGADLQSRTDRDATRRCVRAVLTLCLQRGIIPGIHTTSIEEAIMRIGEGWRLIAVASDGVLLTQAAAATLRDIHRHTSRDRDHIVARQQAYEAGCTLVGPLELGGY